MLNNIFEKSALINKKRALTNERIEWSSSKLIHRLHISGGFRRDGKIEKREQGTEKVERKLKRKNNQISTICFKVEIWIQNENGKSLQEHQKE